jgi:hypothetical protein
MSILSGISVAGGADGAGRPGVHRLPCDAGSRAQGPAECEARAATGALILHQNRGRIKPSTFLWGLSVSIRHLADTWPIPKAVLPAAPVLAGLLAVFPLLFRAVPGAAGWVRKRRRGDFPASVRLERGCGRAG